MSLIGYKRVSSEGQSTDRQDLGELDKVFEEKLSGKSASDRPALLAMIDYARDGDTVWTCHAYVPVSELFYAAFRSNAKGLLPPSDECLRLGL